MIITKIENLTETEFLMDVFNIALEGGITHWAKVNEYHFLDSDFNYDFENFFAIVSDVDNTGTFETRQIDGVTIKQGINNILLNRFFHLPDGTREKIERASENLDAGILDAGDADCIIQAGLFNSLIFG